jgi:hypothetical protein
MSNSETETIQAAGPAYNSGVIGEGGLPPLGKRQTADLARERSWKAACFAPGCTDG